MSDEQLISLAALAYGNCRKFNGAWRCSDTGYREFNPLIDDACAFRLAVKLGLNIIQQTTFAGPEPVAAACGYCVDDMRKTSTDYSGDALAATRRAIVLAAAEIGKGMHQLANSTNNPL